MKSFHVLCIICMSLLERLTPLVPACFSVALCVSPAPAVWQRCNITCYCRLIRRLWSPGLPPPARASSQTSSTRCWARRPGAWRADSRAPCQDPPRLPGPRWAGRAPMTVSIEMYFFFCQIHSQINAMALFCPFKNQTTWIKCTSHICQTDSHSN